MSTRARLAYALSAGAAALILLTLFRPTSKKATYIPSPLRTVLPRLSASEIDALPYPPDALPGGRDVETAYGTIKVFEWGPEDGRKVLFVHGISTPCIALGDTAEKLAQRGCRVMLFDLFGRGYSDAPTEVDHDARLYTTQILLVLASSPISWTGDSAFDLIGYSFGGGISANFTRYFPRLVRSVILLAPGGIVRNKHVSWRSKILYSKGILPERLLAYLVMRRLQPSPSPETDNGAQGERDGPEDSNRDLAEAAVGAEVGRTTSRDDRDQSPSPARALSDRPSLNPDVAVSWQVEHHEGFVTAFMSSIRNGPIHDQHEIWTALGQILAQRRAARESIKDRAAMGLQKDKVLLVIGSKDPIILKDEVPEDAKRVLGKDNVQVAFIDASHDFPIKQSARLVDIIFDFWIDE